MFEHTIPYHMSLLKLELICGPAGELVWLPMEGRTSLWGKPWCHTSDLRLHPLFCPPVNGKPGMQGLNSDRHELDLRS